MTSPRTIIGLGLLATFGAFMGVLADVFSAWSPHTSQMATAFSVDLDNIVALYAQKARWTYVLGNYLGVYFIPLHMLGFFLVFQALKPANLNWSRAFLVLALYLTAIGVGLHEPWLSWATLFELGTPRSLIAFATIGNRGRTLWRSDMQSSPYLFSY